MGANQIVSLVKQGQLDVARQRLREWSTTTTCVLEQGEIEALNGVITGKEANRLGTTNGNAAIAAARLNEAARLLENAISVFEKWGDHDRKSRYLHCLADVHFHRGVISSYPESDSILEIAWDNVFDAHDLNSQLGYSERMDENRSLMSRIIIARG